jgi:hypothetical protein
MVDPDGEWLALTIELIIFIPYFSTDDDLLVPVH